MSLAKAAIACITLEFLGARVAVSEQIDTLAGFVLGSSFEKAQEYAASREWTLKQEIPSQPKEWSVLEAHIGLFICGNKVVAVRRYALGGVDEFASIVWDLQLTRGEPTTQIVTFMSGSTRISNIDTQFFDTDGTEIKIQLQSIAGRVGVSTNHVGNLECAEGIDPN